MESSVGTAEHPAPKFVMVSEDPDEAIGAADDIIGAGVVAIGADAESELSESLPQAASETVNSAAAATAVNCLVRILSPSVVVFYPHY
ncbi:hypothetical protein [Actinoplanes sp. N902-109]|uniref:hypothetical protein n=1 Tax=Actinoplanes sp. (strain N902-109) TaxID=649831 RepID=UPI001E3AA4F5|nr:hypothetical protein [Actinoplanes sp. N902-109]